MSASFESPFDPESQLDESASFAKSAMGIHAGARAGVVNRTHRVVRQRAKAMRERRDHVRSLMVPLILCSAMLILVIVAVWSGLYQYEAAEAAEAMQADVAVLDASNHFLVVLLWFVPVSMALLAAVWLRRARGSADRGTVR
jgi:heme/copper-type cytochrome/quinol oxidase subunit 2